MFSSTFKCFTSLSRNHSVHSARGFGSEGTGEASSANNRSSSSDAVFFPRLPYIFLANLSICAFKLDLWLEYQNEWRTQTGVKGHRFREIERAQRPQCTGERLARLQLALQTPVKRQENSSESQRIPFASRPLKVSFMSLAWEEARRIASLFCNEKC